MLTVQYAAVSALVAQRIEHLTTDQKVGGSSPSERAQLTGPLPAWQRAFPSPWEPRWELREHVSRTVPDSLTTSRVGRPDETSRSLTRFTPWVTRSLRDRLAGGHAQ